MIGVCTVCHQLYDFDSEAATYEPDRICGPCYRARMAHQGEDRRLLAEYLRPLHTHPDGADKQQQRSPNDDISQG
jgi:hypothetical protein